MNISRRALVLALSTGPAAWSKSLVDPWNTGRNRTVVKGYDAVAYFTEGRAAKDSAQYSFEWKGSIWRFASASNRDSFAASPGKYAPQFGGYCAWAVGHGYTADIDAEAFSIVDGQLYLNYSGSVRRQWIPEQSRWIAEGNRNWPGLHK